MDPDDDQGMPDVEDHQETGAERPALAGAPIPPSSRCGRLDTRYRMELGDQFSDLFLRRASGPLITETYRPMIGYYRCGEACTA